MSNPCNIVSPACPGDTMAIARPEKRQASFSLFRDGTVKCDRIHLTLNDSPYVLSLSYISPSPMISIMYRSFKTRQSPLKCNNEFIKIFFFASLIHHKKRKRSFSMIFSLKKGFATWIVLGVQNILDD